MAPTALQQSRCSKVIAATSLQQSLGSAVIAEEVLNHRPALRTNVRSVNLLEHRDERSGERLKQSSATDLDGNACQLGLEELEQRAVEYGRPPPVPTQARRHRLDHQYPRTAAAIADCGITLLRYPLSVERVRARSASDRRAACADVPSAPWRIAASPD